jgi:hypothetical protein
MGAGQAWDDEATPALPPKRQEGPLGRHAPPAQDERAAGRAGGGAAAVAPQWKHARLLQGAGD